MKSEAGKVFGGFTKVNWFNHDDQYAEDSEAFIFSIDRLQVYPVVNHKNAIYQYRNYGP